MYSSICPSSATSSLVLFKGHTCATSRHVLHYKDWVLFRISFFGKMDILGKKNFVGKIRGAIVVHSPI